jgi:hypothetical protein
MRMQNNWVGLVDCMSNVVDLGHFKAGRLFGVLLVYGNISFATKTSCCYVCEMNSAVMNRWKLGDWMGNIE